MIIAYFLLFALCLVGVRPRVRGIHDDYLSVKTTGAGRGIFAFAIFMRHIVPYVTLGDVWIDAVYTPFDRLLGQVVVCLFLFYTGYGVRESYRNKQGYFDSFLEKRFFRTLFHFDLAILLYWLVNVILGKTVKLTTLMQAFIGVSAIGNSNWYMFFIFIEYLLIFFAFRFTRENEKIAVPLVLLLTVGYIFYANRSGISYWWYDTALCVPLGMAYSVFREKIDRALSHLWAWLPVTAPCILVYVFAMFAYSDTKNILWLFPKNVFFTLAWVFLSMKIRVDNAVLRFLGKYSFSLYLVQRIPSMLMQKWLPATLNRYVFVLISFALSILLSVAFTKVCELLDPFIFRKKEKPTAAA